MKKLLLLAIVVLGISGVSFGQDGTATLTAVPATAKIIAPITLTPDAGANNGISFGAIARGTTAGFVTVESTLVGARTKTSDIILSAVDRGHSAKFTVAGESGYTFTITLPTEDEVALNTNKMDITDFRYNGSSSNSGVLTLSGTSLDVYVGATIAVSATQAVGTYNGTFPVTVNYN